MSWEEQQDRDRQFIPERGWHQLYNTQRQFVTANVSILVYQFARDSGTDVYDDYCFMGCDVTISWAGIA
jgi:hypothetical protein